MHSSAMVVGKVGGGEVRTDLARRAARVTQAPDPGRRRIRQSVGDAELRVATATAATPSFAKGAVEEAVAPATAGHQMIGMTRRP